MAITGLFGPFALNDLGVDGNVNGIGPGAYALGYSNQNGAFVVNYVGRSDDDLKGRLKQHIGQGYQSFKFGFFPSAKNAFDKECYLWHDFGGGRGNLDNKVHPAKGANKDWTCPVCGA